jgi:hypothetical protein
VLTAGSTKKMNLGWVVPLDPAQLPLGAGMIQAKVKLTSKAGRGGPNGMIVFGYRDAANYRWVKVTPVAILIGQTGTVGGIPAGVKKKTLKAQRVGRFSLFTVKLHPDGLVEVYKGTPTRPALSYQFVAGVAPGGVGVGASKAKTIFDNVTVWEDSALR